MTLTESGLQISDEIQVWRAGLEGAFRGHLPQARISQVSNFLQPPALLVPPPEAVSSESGSVCCKDLSCRQIQYPSKLITCD